MAIKAPMSVIQFAILTPGRQACVKVFAKLSRSTTNAKTPSTNAVCT